LCAYSGNIGTLSNLTIVNQTQLTTLILNIPQLNLLHL
jgi:hypothetical protein